jgi:hypothetical protein
MLISWVSMIMSFVIFVIALFGCSIRALTNYGRVMITMICDVACKVVVYS